MTEEEGTVSNKVPRRPRGSQEDPCATVLGNHVQQGPKTPKRLPRGPPRPSATMSKKVPRRPRGPKELPRGPHLSSAFWPKHRMADHPHPPPPPHPGAGLRSTQRQRDGGAHLLRQLLKLYGSCRLSAQQLCTLCHSATDAQVPGGNFAAYAMAEGKQSGKYQAFLDKVLPGPGPLHEVPCPMNQNKSPHSSIRQVPMQLVHDCLRDELRDSPDMLDVLNTPAAVRPAASVLDTQVYMNHPAVRAATEEGKQPPVPIAIYVDGVRYQTQAAGRSDSVYGYWIVNLLTGARHMVASIRKSDECSCGCGGWCTHYPVLQSLRWQLEWSQKGVRPPRDMNGGAWPARTTMSPLGLSTALIFIKGDWLEHSHVLGLAAGSQIYGCCSFCTASHDELHSLSHLITSDDGIPWHLRTAESYEADLARCEVDVPIASQAELLELHRNLTWLKTGKVAKCRGIASDLVIVGVRLKAGDRIEPSPEVMDTSNIIKTKLPCTFKFWRKRFGDYSHLPLDSVNHRCPLLCRELGTSPAQSIALDSMHVVNLGIMMRLVSAALWRMILLNSWGFTGVKEYRMDLCCRQLDASLQTWQDENVPRSDRFGHLTMKMLGPSKGFSFEDIV